MDKAIEIIKAAMEKEKAMKEQSKESMDQQIEDQTEESILDKQTNSGEEVNQETPNENIDQSVVEDAPSESGEGKEKASKTFFKNNKSKEMAAKDQKIEELSDRLMRNMAEFENFRKRTEKEKSQMYDMGVKSIIEKFLPIVDNFERGFSTITDKEKEGAFAQGIELIYRQLMSALDEIGVKPIDAVGNEFNTNLHNAVMHGEDDSLGENIVSDEFQKGYLYHDMVVRHSMVKVVN
ncbi:MAG: nucleotide exchange factor GrpE [Mobilitalea sp.]